MNTGSLLIRPALDTDLTAINAIISDCVMRWDLPLRVKRLSLPAYHYDLQDLEHLEIFLATTTAHDVVGVAAIDSSASAVVEEQEQHGLLHGIYVKPESQGAGVGSLLIDLAMSRVEHTGAAGLLVRAQPDAIGFFVNSGFEQLPVMDEVADYPYRFWRANPSAAPARIAC